MLFNFYDEKKKLFPASNKFITEILAQNKKPANYVTKLELTVNLITENSSYEL